MYKTKKPLSKHNESPHWEHIRRSAALVRDCTSIKPQWCIILGSGLSGIADELEEKVIFPYESLPGFPLTTVAGHPGKMVMGRLGDKWVCAFQGRAHIYEGRGCEPALSPVRLAHELRIGNIIIMNAAGALVPPFRPGHLMPITGHLNLMWTFTPGLPAKRPVYDEMLIEKFLDAATARNVPAFPGVYAALTGPTYETPAETRAYRKLGAHAVGMSTAPEAIEANLLGMKVLGVSCITNEAVPAGESDSGPTHELVLANAQLAAENLSKVLKRFINGG